VSLVGENIDLDNLTYHLEDPMGILIALVSGHIAHNDLLPK
jgi:hypothetical protein